MHTIRECTNPTCQFRFPAESDHPIGNVCPKCDGVTVVDQQFAAQLVPTAVSDRAKRQVVGVLDNIRSIHNVGACFRTADGAGLTNLYLCGITATPAHRKVAKTALGSEQAVAWSHHHNALHLVERLKKEGYQLWALEGGTQAESLLTSVLPEGPIAIVVGNEVSGVDPAILALCDRVVALPMRGVKASLNVSTAFGIAAYRLTG
ncbi:MAG: RNA methyltransferase [Candidatus Promineifilaceae bacterium]